MSHTWYIWLLIPCGPAPSVFYYSYLWFQWYYWSCKILLLSVILTLDFKDISYPLVSYYYLWFLHLIDITGPMILLLSVILTLDFYDITGPVWSYYYLWFLHSISMILLVLWYHVVICNSYTSMTLLVLYDPYAWVR